MEQIRTQIHSGATDLTRGPIFRQLLLFSLPLLLGNLFQQLYNAVDFLIVGRVCSNAAQAAVGSSTSLVNLLIGATQGFAVGAGVIISQNFGKGDTPAMRRSIHTAALVGLWLGLLAMGISFLFSRAILTAMQTPDEVMGEAVAYFQVFSVGLFFMVLYNVGSGIFRAVGDNRHPLYALMTAVGLNLLLDLALVAGAGLGVRGAALATVLAQGISVLEEFWVLFHTDDRYRLSWRELHIDRQQLKPILKNALPSSVQNCIVSFSNVVVQSHVNQFGSAAMAGYAAYNKLSSFAVLPATSISLSLTTFASQNLGAGRNDRTCLGVRYGMTLISGITLAIGLVLVGFAPSLIGLFNPDGEVISYGVMMARRAAPFLILLGLSHALTGALRGIGQARVPMLALTLCWCVLRVVWITTLIHFWFDIRVIYWSYPVTWLCSTSVLYYSWRRLRPSKSQNSTQV